MTNYALAGLCLLTMSLPLGCSSGENTSASSGDTAATGSGAGSGGGNSASSGTSSGNGGSGGSGGSGGGASASSVCAPSAGDALPAPLRTLTAQSLDELQALLDEAKPGDEITLKAGEHTASAPITWSGAGTAEHPVVVRADGVGKTSIKGSAGFQLTACSHIVIEGFVLRHEAMDIGSSYQAGLLLEECHDARVTRNDFMMAGDAYSHWVVITGDGSGHNRVDHNAFHDRTTEGNFIVVYGPDGKMSQEDRIDHNHFTNHGYDGSNGGESLRIGDSKRQLEAAGAVVECNLFEQCNGDVEVISMKSSKNFVRHNTLRENRGSITMRHGNDNVIDGNILLDGENGIRVYGNRHRVINNYLAGNSGEEGYSTLVIGGGDERDSDAGSTMHDAADDVIVAFNTLVNNANGLSFGAGSGYDKGDLPPDAIMVANNVIVSEKGVKIVHTLVPTGSMWAGNLFWGASEDGPLPKEGVETMKDPGLMPGPGGLLRPGAASPLVDNAAPLMLLDFVATDMDGDLRSSAKDIGADEVTPSPSRVPLTKADVGPGSP